MENKQEYTGVMPKRDCGIRRECYRCEHVRINARNECECNLGKNIYTRRFCADFKETGHTCLDGLKVCTCCHKVYSQDMFSKDKDKKDGKSVYCRYCVKAKRLSYYD